MRVLIIGATGLLGRVLLEEWAVDQVTGASSRDADIRDERQVRDLFARCKPEWTVLAAAYTDVDGCERNPELAHQVNCVGASNVARAARAYGSQLMLLSTDYVFDGTKSTPYEVDDPVAPLNVYGRTKAIAEAAVREILPDGCILRTSWLFGACGKCFPNTILKLAHEHKELSVVADQRGCPTLNRDLASAIVKLSRARAQGTIHATNAGVCSWFAFAQALLRAAGRTDVAVKPIRTEELGRPARRPKYSALSSNRLRQYGISLRPWEDALPQYLREWRVSSQAREQEALPLA